MRDVAGTSDPPVVGEHRFVPDEPKSKSRGSVRFSNDDHVEADGVVAPVPPHSWTLLTDGCEPDAEANADEACAYDSGVLNPGESALVPLTGLAPGDYTFICKVGQSPQVPFSLVLPPHATEDGGTWKGMVGTLTVKA